MRFCRSAGLLTVLVGALWISGLRAQDISSLQPGTYVQKSVACGEAANASIMNFDGDRFTAGRFCPASVGGQRGSTIVISRACGDEGQRRDTFVINSGTEFALKNAIGEFSYRLCEQSTLPEMWRGMVKTAEAPAQRSITATPCQIANDFAERGEIRWNGECKDGFAHGTGTAQWFKNGLLNWQEEYQRTNGLVRERGATQLMRDVIDRGIKLTMGSCDRSASYRHVRVDATPEIALHNGFVDNYVMNMRAQTFAWQQCPMEGVYSNVSITVYVQGKETTSARSYGQLDPRAPQNTKWQEYTNYAYGRKHTMYEGIYNRGVAERQAQAHQEAQRRQQEERQRVADAKRAVRAKFMTDNSVSQFVPFDQLAANPFVYRNQTVAVYAQFVRMISESEAIFQASQQLLFVDRVPSTLFRGSAMVALAIRANGTKQTSALGATLTVPYGSYVGAYACQQMNCNDFRD